MEETSIFNNVNTQKPYTIYLTYEMRFNEENGNKQDIYFDASNDFKEIYKISWFDDPLCVEIVETIDNAHYICRDVFEDQWRQTIIAPNISSGAKQLLMMLYFPNKLYSCDRMGENCIKFIKPILDRVKVLNLAYTVAPDLNEIDLSKTNIILTETNHCIKDYHNSLADFINVRKMREFEYGENHSIYETEWGEGKFEYTFNN